MIIVPSKIFENLDTILKGEIIFAKLILYFSILLLILIFV